MNTRNWRAFSPKTVVLAANNEDSAVVAHKCGGGSCIGGNCKNMPETADAIFKKFFVDTAR